MNNGLRYTEYIANRYFCIMEKFIEVSTTGVSGDKRDRKPFHKAAAKKGVYDTPHAGDDLIDFTF